MDQIKTFTRVPHGIECASFDQRFRHPSVTRNSIDLIQIVSEVFKRTFLPARRNNRLDNIFTNIADRTETKSDIFANGLERIFRRINVGRQHINTQVTAIRKINGRLIFFIGH